MQNIFSIPIKLYTDDIDFYGILHHSRTVNFFEHARNDWLIHLGFSLSDLKNQNIFFVVRNLTVEFIKPVLLESTIEATAAIEHLGKSSIVFKQSIREKHNANDFFCKGEVVVVCINEKGRPRRLPQGIYDYFNQLEA